MGSDYFCWQSARVFAEVGKSLCPGGSHEESKASWWSMAGCGAVGLRLPSPSALSESTCSMQRGFLASQQGYQERAHWEIRASVGEGDPRQARCWGQVHKSGCLVYLGWRGGCEMHPCCPQTQAVSKEWGNFSSISLLAVFIDSDLSTLTSSLQRR